ncbi:DUF1993 domain-containing protein [Aspergillus mulundensis]|uniref:DUF1993 domain-containing protein n=1 Tax=Aspergillus mulundensis TaxID=1810919 RepID=A0A3D8RS18_9EURO|nr:Uncharacterized protein DSM5745_06845 [Aspergillus mulundensis]RDW76853.1 Uncharacterized protein DSM5745_06845 [Aspergillus mulundensis]
MSALYTYTFTPLLRGLKSLKTTLQKAESHAQANNIAPETYVTASLIDDMKPLSFQVFIVANAATKVLARSTFVEPPQQEDTDKTFDDFYARIDETIAALEKVDVEVLKANEGKTFKAPLGPIEAEFTPESYATSYAMPNFFFHLVTAYGILRAKGVPVGKLDYLKDFLDVQL